MPRGALPGERRGGRVKGTPNRLSKAYKEDVKAIALGMILDPVYLDGLKARLQSGTAGIMESKLWDYGFGRPTADSAGDGTLPTSITINF
jgi:hypothetical protein